MIHGVGPAVRGGGHKDSSSVGGVWSVRFVRPVQQGIERSACESDKVCNYCHKRGHWRHDCYALKSRSKHTESSFAPKLAMFVAPAKERLLAGSEAEPQVSGVGIASF